MRKNWVALVLTVAFAATMTLLGLGPGGSAAPTSSSDRSKARETIKYYDVRGTTIEELRHEVYSRGPYDSTGQRFAGWAEWRIRWWYDPASASPVGRSGVSGGGTIASRCRRAVKFRAP